MRPKHAKGATTIVHRRRACKQEPPLKRPNQSVTPRTVSRVPDGVKTICEALLGFAALYALLFLAAC